ncbi:MAG: hypothetical protein PHP44_11205 [Kiritimatiellae bacterium]|nr:hypothetical protein [Kiritimatiellia bacterium]MDD4736658.1 hypothetical protein [Kiritimatiellia bacterium]
MRIKKKTIAGVAGLCLMLLASGCAMMPGGVAPSNIPIEGRRYTNLGRTAKSDSRFYLLGIIPLSGANTTRDAIDAAIRSKRGDALINITVESYSQWWIILTRIVTRVDGEVIRFE